MRKEAFKMYKGAKQETIMWWKRSPRDTRNLTRIYKTTRNINFLCSELLPNIK